jgi:hypothetical protein
MLMQGISIFGLKPIPMVTVEFLRFINRKLQNGQNFESYVRELR